MLHMYTTRSALLPDMLTLEILANLSLACDASSKANTKRNKHSRGAAPTFHSSRWWTHASSINQEIHRRGLK